MSLATTYCRAQYGMNAPKISVETHLSNGLPAFNIVGLAQTSVKESKDRVRSAIINSLFEFPQRRITINLAPAELPKQGGRYDLAIAIGILAASGQIPKQDLAAYEFLGELSLSGELRAINAALPAALQGKKNNTLLIFAADNAREISLSRYDNLYLAKHLLEVSAHLLGAKTLANCTQYTWPRIEYAANFKRVKGQEVAKRALSIVAAGRHHLLMSGPPGSGKTLLANCLPSILPPMSAQESIETASIYSLDNRPLLSPQQRSFCAPHHSASAVALVGGGNPPKPGEISRAH
ncbi:UNVERIFIED_CONTAM: hypothetical protein GTU68_040749, partial [Idotea baltica]|nr:hypothetical protein [Idotea baltica]